MALGLIAYDLAGADASIVLGIALTIKMISYVTLAPIAAALASQYPRRNWLVTLDILRALVALTLPFVSEIWQIYVLIFVMQASSAGFTPALTSAPLASAEAEGRKRYPSGRNGACVNRWKRV